MKRKTLQVIILAIAMVLTSYSVIFAETDPKTVPAPTSFYDVSRHWAKAAIYKWSGKGVINGYAGSFRPNDSLTRGEMAVILDNMMDYQAAADNTFTDLKEGRFYTAPLLKANAAGIIKGSGSKIRPTDKITREEAAVMLARAFAVDARTDGTPAFSDVSAIASWAKGYVAAMEAKGYIKGTNNHYLPKNNITRAEIVTMIDNIVKAYYTEAGTYTENVAGTAVVKVTGVILKGMSISENLIIAEGVGEGDVTLDSVTVKREAVIRGGGQNSVHIIGTSSITSVRVERINGVVRLVIANGSTIQEITVAAGEKIIITGQIGALDITASNVVVNTENAQIGSTSISGDNVTVESNENSTAVTRTGSSGKSSSVIRAVNISGKAAVGSTLTANPTPSHASGTYQWQRADAIDGPFMNIGTDSKTYTLTEEDEGKYIIVGVTGAGIYSGAQTSSGIGPVTAQPVMTGTVSIDGAAKYNETLTANITGIIYTPATSDHVPAYQWKRNGSAISGATGNTYILAADDIGTTVTVTVTADGTNATGAGITSEETAAIVKADGPTAPATPTLASKTHNTVTLSAISGAEYRVDGGAWQSSPIFNGLKAEATYTFTARIEETATHFASAESSAATIETGVFPLMAGTVSIDGITKYNETLTANTAGLTYTPNTSSNVLACQWKRNGSPISGATGNTYQLTAADIGTAITVTVTADGTNATGAGITSEGTAAIAKADRPGEPSEPTLASKTHNTVTLSAFSGAEYRMDGGAWQSSPVFTGLTAEAAYTFTARIEETATHFASAESSAATIETGVFPLMAGTVSIDGITKYNETLIANISGLTYTPNTASNVPAYQWKRNESAISGATGNTYALTSADIGTTLTVTVTADGTNATGAGITSSQTSVIEKADRPAPAAPALASKTHNTITLSAISGAEYRMNGGTWQSSPVFTGLTAETSCDFTARIKETATHYISAESSPVTIETGIFPVMGGTVTIDGITKYNRTLTANITGITYIPDTTANVPSYQWKRNGTDISGATANTYTLTEADIATTITVTVTADGTNATGAGITSTGTATIEKADRPAPAAPTPASKTNNTITLTVIAGAEYRMDGGAWQSSPIFTGLTARTLYNFTARFTESSTHYGSTESVPTAITTASETEIISVLGVDFKLIYAPGGTYATGFLGGTATAGSGFWMSETEVTYELWYAVLTWAKDNGYTFWVPGMEGSVTGGGDHVSNYVNKGKPPTGASQEPVTLITTYDMMAWLNALSELTGRQPVYYSTLDGGGHVFKDALGAGITAGLTVKVEPGNGYRLPNQNQWEYAARWKGSDSSNGAVSAGGQYWTPAQYASGATANYSNAAATGAVAWYSANSQKTQPVAQKAANGLGFYDMSGNVWEVVYSSGSLFCGGSFNGSAELLRAADAYRFNNDYIGVTIEGTNIGFRLVRP